MKSPEFYQLKDAQWYLNHFWAGLLYDGRDEDGEEQWIGKDKNRNALTWLEDGAYEDMPDKGQSLVAEYLAQ